jgi:hypothetical protein
MDWFATKCPEWGDPFDSASMRADTCPTTDRTSPARAGSGKVGPYEPEAPSAKVDQVTSTGGAAFSVEAMTQ